MADPGSLEEGWGVLENYGHRQNPAETTGFDLGAVSGMGGGGIAQRLGELNARERARQIADDREIGQLMAENELRQQAILEGSRTLRTGAAAFSPYIGESSFMSASVPKNSLMQGYGFSNPFKKSNIPSEAYDQMWKTATGQKMVPVWHGTRSQIDPFKGWDPELASHHTTVPGARVDQFGNRYGWYAHATHDPGLAQGFTGYPASSPLAGDVPLSEFRRGFQYSSFREPELRLAADDWNKVFQMGQHKDNPLAKLTAKTIHTPGRFARALPFAGATLGYMDMATRTALGDYAGAVLSGIGMVPGPVGWAGLGTQMAYDIIMAGINNGTFETQQDIDDALGITGPPGIRGDY